MNLAAAALGLASQSNILLLARRWKRDLQLKQKCEDKTKQSTVIPNGHLQLLTNSPTVSTYPSGKFRRCWGTTVWSMYCACFERGRADNGSGFHSQRCHEPTIFGSICGLSEYQAIYDKSLGMVFTDGFTIRSIPIDFFQSKLSKCTHSNIFFPVGDGQNHLKLSRIENHPCIPNSMLANRHHLISQII